MEKGICGICPFGCGVEITLENDRITKIFPWKGHIRGVPCVRGMHAPEIIYSPDRLTRPLKRKCPKGSLDFEPVSWDQALDEIASKIFKLKEQYGAECIASFFGRGNFEESLWRMFTAKTKGFSVGNSIFMPLGSPNAFSVGSLCYISYGLLAPVSTFGMPMRMLVSDVENADVIFVWGTRLSENPPMEMVKLREAKKRGTRIIVIDPIKTSIAKDAHLWVPIQPGTDMALIYGILSQCLRSGSVNKEFAEDFCLGFDKLEAYVKDFNPERVEAITRVPKATIIKLAELISSTEKATLLNYTGLEYSNIGVHTTRSLLTLWALTGHFDVVGGLRVNMLFPVPFRKPDVQAPTDAIPIGRDEYPLCFQMTNGAHFMEFPRSVLDGDPYKIRFLLIGGASILTSFPNTTLFRKALAALDYLVCADIFLNADACYADIVLPATTFYEMSSLYCYQNVGPSPFSIQYRKKIIEPVGESMSSYLIYARLAERLGYGHYYPRTEDGMVEYLIKDLPIDFSTFKSRSEQGPIPLYQDEHPPYEERKWLSGKLRPDGKAGFATPSGKWEIISSIIEKSGCDPFPAYEAATEGPENRERVKDFPLTLTTGARLRSTFRSQHLNIPGLIKLQPNAGALIHPTDARPRNISTGDTVRVKTARGEALFTAHVTEDILSGVVEVNQGGGTPIQTKGWRESNVNLLTDDQNRDPVSGFPVFKALLCQVEGVYVSSLD
jgi:anaerobic selenocysteine-containing dehydrogenase